MRRPHTTTTREARTMDHPTTMVTGAGIVLTGASMLAQVTPAGVPENPGQMALVGVAGAFATMLGSVAVQMLKNAREARIDRRREREAKSREIEWEKRFRDLKRDNRQLQQAMKDVLVLSAKLGGVQGQNEAAMAALRASGFLLPEPICPKLLVVEDVPDAAQTLMRALQCEEFVVTHAATLAEGVAAWRRDRPDWVLLDRGLPDGDGLKLLRRIRAEKATTKVAVLTAACDEAADAEVEALSPDLYMQKPFDVDALIAGIRAAIDTGEYPVFKNPGSMSGSGIIVVPPLPGG